MKIYEDIEAERSRVEKCISSFGWTSDHNLDWFIDSIIDASAKPVFVEFEDGSGLLTHKHPDRWRIWSDPISKQRDAVARILEFSKFVLEESATEVWCDDVSDTIYPELKKAHSITLNEIYYSLFWTVLDMVKYDPDLPGGHFKEMRNAKSKFYREHEVTTIETKNLDKKQLLEIVDRWFEIVIKKQKEDVYDLRYRNAIESSFRGFTTARALVVDGRPVGINAGYEVPNTKTRFAGIVGIHDYSIKDLGTILWLEDLGWIKNAGYKELDMQGMEYEWEIKTKTQYGAVVERKTNTFSIQR